MRTAAADVQKAIEGLGSITTLPVSDIILTSGSSAGHQENTDGGAAAWFIWDNVQRCVAFDLYAASAANLSAIGQIINSCSAEYRRGSLAAVRQILLNYTPHITTQSSITQTGHWSELLGVGPGASAVEITAAFRRLALEVHPDKGGTREQWDRLIDAYDEARGQSAPENTESDNWLVPETTEDELLWNDIFRGT